jgi:two-component system alkaline phosphatase synthesis response regulator PhoP
MKTNYRIAIVEDEVDIAELVRYNLQQEGYVIETYTSGEVAWSAIEKNPPDAVVLDVMLPGMSGLEICAKMKSQKNTESVPIVMASAKGSEEDIVKGLELGADDYVTKPFSLKILKARVAAVLRRKAAGGETVHSDQISSGGISINTKKVEVLVNAIKVDLTQSEFKILQFLAGRPGWVFTRMQIVEAIRGENYAVTERTIDFQMVGLRKKLGDAGHLIETVRGVGYRFRDLTD